MDNLNDLARSKLHDFVRSSEVAVFSTAEPWTWQCWYASDERLNLYFVSKINRRHSAYLIQHSTNVSGAILIDRFSGGAGTKVGSIFCEGAIEQVAEGEVNRCFAIYADRWRAAPSISAGNLTADLLRNPDGLDRLWKFVPAAFVLYDEREKEFPSPRQEIVTW